MGYIQNGDVLLHQHVGDMPGTPLKGEALLHKGQNHHHILRGGAFLIIQGESVKFLDVAEDTELTHEEHKTLVIPRGQYRIGFVQEYDHWLEESRNIID